MLLMNRCHMMVTLHGSQADRNGVRRRGTIPAAALGHERRGKKHLSWFLMGWVCLVFSDAAHAEWEIKQFHDALVLTTGVWDGAESEETVVPLAELVEAPQAPWIRAHFGAFHLGEKSYVTITSLLDGDTQRLDARSMADYQNATAYFNGDALDVQLHIAPGETGIFATINGITYGDPSQDFQIPEPSPLASLCGADSRVASSEPRVGRLFGGGCTAWLVSNEAALTAGHCGNPDGNVTGMLQFNVPASTANGNPVQPPADDQYPITANSVTFESDGTGEDWSIFRVGPNSNTNLRPHVAQGFYRMTSYYVPAEDTTMRVTGYGLDNTPSGSGGAGAQCCDENNDNACEFDCNAQSLTEQTSTGRFDELSGTTLEYEVDTTPANSGSPVIWNSNGLTVGIHTAGGCDDFLSGNENHGTWFGYSLLGNAVNNYGSGVVWVDHVNVSIFQLGSVLHPAKSVPFGIALAPDGGRVRMLPGSYTAAAGNTFTVGADGKAVTLDCPLGTAVIGN